VIINPTLYNKLYIINVYNKVATNTLQDLRETIGKIGSYNELFILEDFNLYYLLWLTTHRHANNGI
jgi:hypothetical protein